MIIACWLILFMIIILGGITTYNGYHTNKRLEIKFDELRAECQGLIRDDLHRLQRLDYNYQIKSLEAKSKTFKYQKETSTLKLLDDDGMVIKAFDLSSLKTSGISGVYDHIDIENSFKLSVKWELDGEYIEIKKIDFNQLICEKPEVL